MLNRRARILAFYLPQFHPIPENDKWWGKGFTEWTNVGKAKPLFKGHYQPRVPADLGYYDLRIPEIREAQAEMARNAGVEGFMYWHYWFGNGKTLLEKPFQEVLHSGKPDFPFCLGWANHSWANKTWDSASQKRKSIILVQQLYPGKQDFIDHFNFILKAFNDKRYVHVDGKPVFYVYNPFDIKECKLFIDTWQELSRKNGFKGIHFVGRMAGWLNDKNKLIDFGFDAVNTNTGWVAESKITGKLLNRIIIKIKFYTKINILQKYRYSDIIKYLSCELDKDENIYPTIIPQYDHTPRMHKVGVVYHGSTPKLFKKHLHEVISIVASKKSEHRIIFLKSWNEWAESNYVEPDLVYGHGYLDVLKDENLINQL